ncbi:hypothetical protein FQN50_003957 [Emmonsiellopsis sp. PD_5]|nr:hypothetical protein FQN50_003957 [Emmonsiellopsis sp. PD_5]
MKFSISAAALLAGSAFAAPVVNNLPIPGLDALSGTTGISKSVLGGLVPAFGSVVNGVGLLSLADGLPVIGQVSKIAPIKARDDEDGIDADVEVDVDGNIRRAEVDAEVEIEGVSVEKSAEIVTGLKQMAKTLKVDKATNGQLPVLEGVEPATVKKLLSTFQALVKGFGVADKIAPGLKGLPLDVIASRLAGNLLGGLGGATSLLSKVAGPLGGFQGVLGLTQSLPLLGGVLSSVGGRS